MSENSQNNKSYRIKYDVNNPNDQNIVVNLKQKYDFLDVGSLKIDMSNFWKTQSSDYGVLIGRVIANGGVGIPNAKISVFIPVDSLDLLNPDVLSVYPFQTPKDIAPDGKRYNLLKRVKTFLKSLGWVKNIFGLGTSPKYPRGSRPDRIEIMTNPTLAYIHEKYYKFVTVTNDSGDYMITGIPVGTHTIHMDCDLTDIGTFSMKPGTMIKTLGYSDNLFENGTTPKNTNDLDNIVNIQSQDLSVNIRSFWGNSPDEEIGITRQDFTLKGEIVPDSVVFGAGFTMGGNAYYGDKIIFRVEITSKELFHFELPHVEFTVDTNFPFVHITITTTTIYVNIPKFTVYGPSKKYCQINGGKFDKSAISFLFDYKPFTSGNDPTQDSDLIGDETEKLNLNTHRILPMSVDVFTYDPKVEPKNLTNIDTQISLLNESKYIKYISNGQFALSIPCNRTRKITNELGQLVISDDPNKGIFTEFKGYFIVKIPTGDIIHPPTDNQSARVFMKIPQNTYYNKKDNGNEWVMGDTLGYHTFKAGKIYTVSQYIRPILNDWWTSPAIIKEPENGDMIYNYTDLIGNNFFAGEWLNGCLYFPQYMYKIKREHAKVDHDKFCPDIVYNIDKDDNIFGIGGGVLGVRHLLRGDYHPTKFVEIPKNDYLKLLTNNNKGIKMDINYKGKYPSVYFYKGLYNSDCVKYIYNNNLL